MKKIFFSLVAIAAMAACTKSEVQYEQQQEIGFAPVAHNVTKSVAGIDGTAFPTTQNLYVFANSQDQDVDGTLSNAWSQAYLTNAEFLYNRLANGVYEGKDPYYWPNVKSLIFAGYSEACNSASLNPVMDFSLNKLTIGGYIQNNTVGYTEVEDSEGNKTITVKPGANDLMWFPWNGNAYTKTTEAIPVTMKHACSWITVKVLGDGVTANNWKLHELKINDLYHEGTATCGATEATWVVSGVTNFEKVFENTTGTPIPATATAMENVADNMVVIPQVPTTLDVTYSYTAQSGQTITEIKKGLALKYNGDSKWMSGKHYTYTITISAAEILIAPTVEEWLDGPSVNHTI